MIDFAIIHKNVPIAVMGWGRKHTLSDNYNTTIFSEKQEKILKKREFFWNKLGRQQHAVAAAENEF